MPTGVLSEWRSYVDLGIVGGYLDVNGSRTNATLTSSLDVSLGQVPFSAPISGVSIELLIKPGDCFSRGGGTRLFATGGFEYYKVLISGSSIVWDTFTDPGPTPGQDSMTVPLNGCAQTSADYLADGTWHHLAFVKDAATGAQAVYIDGKVVGSLPKNATGRSFSKPHAISLDPVDSVAFCAAIDELAIYETALPAETIQQHFLDATVHHRPYTMGQDALFKGMVDHVTANNATATDPTALTNCTPYDVSEFMPGTILPSPHGNNTVCSGCPTCLSQLQSFPDPRYEPSAVEAFGIIPNYNWMAPGYMAGENNPAVDRRTVDNTSVLIQAELAKKWGYGIVLDGHLCCSDRQNLTIKLANALSHVSLDVNIIRQQIRGGMQLHNQSLPTGCYVQNAAKQFVNCVGHSVPSTKKVLRPTSSVAFAEAIGCPDSLFDADGQYFRDKVFGKFEGMLQRRINRVNEDGEIFVSIGAGEGQTCAADPLVLKDYLDGPYSKILNTSNNKRAGWETYSSAWRVRLTQRFKAIFLTDPGFKTLEKVHYSEYQVQGDNNYFGKFAFTGIINPIFATRCSLPLLTPAGNWTMTRHINTPYASRGGQYYSTADFYPRHPQGWMTTSGPWHGIEWLLQVRAAEIARGDKFFSPFVAMGWSPHAEDNIRPAQSLGLLKIVQVWGAEFFYTGFFSVSKPFPHSANWCYQAAMPSYAQALLTQYAPIFFNGTLANATTDPHIAGGGWGGCASAKCPQLGAVRVPSKQELHQANDKAPLLWAGAANRVAIGRKRDGVAQWVFALAIQRNSNTQNNSMLEAPATLNVKGIGHPLRLTARLQGSVYIYDESGASEGIGPTIKQVDGWHEATHPARWSKEMVYEAELFTGHLDDRNKLVVTEVPDGTVAGDFGTFTTFVRFPPVGNQQVMGDMQLSYQISTAPTKSTDSRQQQPCLLGEVRVRCRTSMLSLNYTTGAMLSLNGVTRHSVAENLSSWSWITLTDIPARAELVLSGSGIDVDALYVRP
jgi:hypothetical protein